MYYFILNKPSGCISATWDHRKRSIIYDHVPNWYPKIGHVGRLDYNTEGLMLFTDDGRLHQALLNKSFSGLALNHSPIEKVYNVKVRPILPPDSPIFEELVKPLIYPDGTITSPAKARWLLDRARSSWIEITITEGRNHQVRLICGRSKLEIVKLRRVKIGPLQLGDLKLRWCRPLAEEEIFELYKAALPEDPFPEISKIEPTRPQD